MSPIPVADMGDMTHLSNQITAWLGLDRPLNRQLSRHLGFGWCCHQIFAGRQRFGRFDHRLSHPLNRHLGTGWCCHQIFVGRQRFVHQTERLLNRYWMLRHQIFAGRYHQLHHQWSGCWKPCWL